MKNQYQYTSAGAFFGSLLGMFVGIMIDRWIHENPEEYKRIRDKIMSGINKADAEAAQPNELDSMSAKELRQELQKVLVDENYERAIEIRDFMEQKELQ